MKGKYSLESFNAGHFFEDLELQDSFYCRKFFGGLSIYVYGRLVACLTETPGGREFRGKKYKIELWNGCLIPTNREYHEELLNLVNGTLPHPVITKWLYLPQTAANFEDSMVKLVGLIKKQSALVGVETEVRAKPKSKSKPKDPRKIKISKMRNLGPAVEKDFNAIGIHRADQIIKLGPEKAFIKMLKGRVKLKRSTKCCNAIYLYALYGAIHNINWWQIPETKKKKFKIFTEKLRKSGKFNK